MTQAPGGVALAVIGGLAFAVASIPGAFREQIWATGLGLLLTGLLVGRQWLALRLILDRVQSRARAWALALSVLPVVLVYAALAVVMLSGSWYRSDFGESCQLRYPRRRWRVRAAKGARLESVCGGDSTVGSNPTATAMTQEGEPGTGLALLRAVRGVGQDRPVA